MEDREWVEEYAKLIISIDSDQRLKAIQLKNQHTPSKLYRYRPLHNLKHIQNELNGKIYLSHQNELNILLTLALFFTHISPQNFFIMMTTIQTS